MTMISDSTIWRDTESFAKNSGSDTRVRIGIVRSAEYSNDVGDTVYVVEVQSNGDRLFVPCRYARRFGGAFNYEDYQFQTYKFDTKTDPIPAFETKAGDTVIVAYLNGDAREGVILGSLSHLARKSTLKPTDGPQYLSSFNGIERSINKDGEYTVTFRGQPTNLSILKQTPKGKIPSPKYDDAVGTSYYKFDKTGSWTLSDNAKSDKQSIYVNKKDGKIVVTSGKIVLTMDKAKQLTTLVTKDLAITAANSMTTKTKDWATEASATAKIKSPKIAFGTDGTELLDQIIKLIDAIGKLTPITPVGPTSPVKASPQWSGVDAVRQAISGIKGTL